MRPLSTQVRRRKTRIGASVTVLLEIGPRFDDQAVLSDPNVISVMTTQAQDEADEMFRSYHPDAVIEHVNNDALLAPPIR